MVNQAFLDAIIAPTTVAYRNVDIYEEDGTTPYYLGAPIVDGSVTVDGTRDERRMFDLNLDRIKGGELIRHAPGAIWYDKVFKVQRGVITPDGVYQNQLGEFVIDNIKEKRFPKYLSISGRDYTKKMLVSKFARATNFTAGSSPEELIRDMAANAGIFKVSLPVTGKTISTDQYFDRGVTRWEACKKIANSYNYDLYFDANGYLVMAPFVDPSTSPTVFTFKTGSPDGTIADYDKSSNDSQLYNHVAVTGEGAGQIPVVAEALNTQPDSPTSIDEIGDRLYEFVSSFIYTTEQAQDVADSFLKIHALEQFDINLNSLIIPWLDVNTVIQFIDPDPNPNDPDRFLLSSMSMPLGLGTMTAVGKRITIVG